MIVRIVCGGGNDPYDRDEYMETRLDTIAHATLILLYIESACAAYFSALLYQLLLSLILDLIYFFNNVDFLLSEIEFYRIFWLPGCDTSETNCSQNCM